MSRPERRPKLSTLLPIGLLALTSCQTVDAPPPELVEVPPKIAPGWQPASARNTGATNKPDFDPVFIRTSFGAVGNGARFRLRNGCVTVTASHVVKDTNLPTITPAASSAGDATVDRLDRTLDIALVKQSHRDLKECPAFPASDTVANSIYSARQREVWYREAGGAVTPINVDLVRASDTELALSMSPGSVPPRFIPGMSGAVVVFDGTPVAILKSVETGDDGVANATRLDAVSVRFKDHLPQPLPAVATTKAAEPYDLNQLPSFYRKIVQSARKTKEKVFGVIEVAEATKIKSENAAAIARLNPRGEPVNNHAHFTATNGNDYAGEVYSIGRQYGSNGYGISEDGSKNGFGNKYYCKFERNKGCQGIGVIDYVENPGNSISLDIWMGNLENSARKGYGYLAFRKSANNPEQEELWYYHDTGNPHPGVWKKPDGRLYEGMIGTSWDGWGVLWDAKGQVQTLAKWEKAKIVQDQTEAWRSGALQ